LSGRPWLGFALSVALHAVVIGLALLVVTRDEPLPALMVDLRDLFVPRSGSVTAPARHERAAPAPRASRALRSRDEVASAPRPAPAPIAAPSPPPPPAIESVPTPVPAASSSIEPAREPAPGPIARERAEPKSSGASAASHAPAASGAGTGMLSGGAAVGGTRPAGGGSTAALEHGVGAGGGGDGGTSGPRIASVPPGAGAGGGISAEYGPYLAALRQRIQQSVRYPSSARRRGVAGTVNVEILILANGTIAEVTVLESSSHAVLDEAALDTIRALPRMPLPMELAARPLRVRVPVVFQLR
jgi:periplasmic protein TonB